MTIYRLSGEIITFAHGSFFLYTNKGNQNWLSSRKEFSLNFSLSKKVLPDTNNLEIEEKYSVAGLDILDESNLQTIMDFIYEIIKHPCEGEICPLVVSAIEHLFHDGKRLVVPHNVNESGASSKEVGDIDIFDSEEQLISSIEVKDKDFTKEDVEHAINKFTRSKIEKSLFIFGKNVNFDKKEVYNTTAELGRLGYFCSVISIEDFVRMRLYSLERHISLVQFIELLLQFAKNINVKNKTIEWIKSCAIEFAL